MTPTPTAMTSATPSAATTQTWLRLVRCELHKLTTTKLPWAFLGVAVVIATLDAAVVAFGTDIRSRRSARSVCRERAQSYPHPSAPANRERDCR